MGNAFPTARPTTTWTLMAGAEVGGATLHHIALLFSPPSPQFSDAFILFVASACHSSCASCWGPSVSQCSLCPGGLLLHQGQCVEACGEGLYAQDNTCHSENCFLICYSELEELMLVTDEWTRTTCLRKASEVPEYSLIHSHF